jgi:DNA topoisomerase I
MKLLVVESPVKSKKIWGLLKYLYPHETWQVVASIGHLIDLPYDDIAVDVEDNFKSTFVVTNKRALNSIRKEAKSATEIYLGMDDDAEGEGIARRIYDQLSGMGKPLRRVRFHEVTAKAIKKAIDSPGELDWSLAEAQAARRILDRIIGYKISPVLWRQLGQGLSAGRVQSCALKLVVDRTIERRQFVPEQYWQLKIKLTDGNYALSERLSSEQDTKDLAALVSKASLEFCADKVNKKPAPPFTTAALLQVGTSKLRKSSADIMKMAQKLFDAGLISYHRTPSIHINGGAIKSIRKRIEDTIGASFLSPKQRFYPPSGAHEAIRPTDINTTPSTVTGQSKDAIKLYKLIWARTMACQAAEAIVENQHIEITSEDGDLIARTHGNQKLLYPGWYQVSLNLFTPKFNSLDPKAAVDSWDTITDWTEPPSRYTESTLIRKLEDAGVGRPSTYASIISGLRKHGYIKSVGYAIEATPRAELLIRFMEEAFGDLLQTSFTAQMEEWLDNLAEGQDSVLSRTIILKYYWEWLAPLLSEATKFEIPVGDKCDCGADLWPLVSRKGMPYLKCSKCKKFHGFDLDDKGIIRIFKSVKVKGPCKHCKAQELWSAQSSHGRYIVCDSCGKAQPN